MENRKERYTLLVDGKIPLDFELAGKYTKDLETYVALQAQDSYVLCRYLSQEEEERFKHKNYLYAEGRESERMAVRILAEADDIDHAREVIDKGILV